jgi:hypothetical protein
MACFAAYVAHRAPTYVWVFSVLVDAVGTEICEVAKLPVFIK